MLGTEAAAVALCWRGFYWPERFNYVFTPFTLLLLLISTLFDLVYPFFFLRTSKEPELGSSGKNGKTS